jgi:hypothetical protein
MGVGMVVLQLRSLWIWTLLRGILSGGFDGRELEVRGDG